MTDLRGHSDELAREHAQRDAESHLHGEHLDRARHGHRHSHATHAHDHGHHDGGHSHSGHAHGHGHHDGGHSHGLIHDSIKRSRDGVRAVLVSLGVLGLAAVAQTAVYALSGSVALLADLIHNFGDALTAVPLGIAFLLRSERAERTAGLFVVAAIFISACVAGVEAVLRLIHQHPPGHLWTLAAAGAIGYVGNHIAAKVRTRAGHRLESPALIADGDHARADAYVSLAVIASAIVVAIGLPIADPLIGLAITLVILRITWQSWGTVRGHEHRH
jgi:Co/Zn/Cd efflux system component